MTSFKMPSKNIIGAIASAVSVIITLGGGFYSMSVSINAQFAAIHTELAILKGADEVTQNRITSKSDAAKKHNEKTDGAIDTIVADVCALKVEAVKSECKANINALLMQCGDKCKNFKMPF